MQNAPFPWVETEGQTVDVVGQVDGVDEADSVDGVDEVDGVDGMDKVDEAGRLWLKKT